MAEVLPVGADMRPNFGHCRPRPDGQLGRQSASKPPFDKRSLLQWLDQHFPEVFRHALVIEKFLAIAPKVSEAERLEPQ